MRCWTLLQRLEPLAESIGATFFEITTAAAFAYFADENVDVAVIETGLGGALDSTNVLDPVVATVTNISLDHTEFLGTTLQSIADEKAGIFKFGRPAVIGEPRLDLARRLADRAAERGATPISVVRSDWRAWSVSLAGGMTSFTAATPLGSHSAIHTAHRRASGSEHAGGAGDASRCRPEYAIKKENINKALSSVTLPGRFQRVRDWVFDVAHNAAGARALAETLAARRSPPPVTIVLGVLKDKDWQGMIDALAPVADHFIITQPMTAPQSARGTRSRLRRTPMRARCRCRWIPSSKSRSTARRHCQEPRLCAGRFTQSATRWRCLAIDPGAPAQRARRVTDAASAMLRDDSVVARACRTE